MQKETGTRSCLESQNRDFINAKKKKGKGPFYLTSVVSSVLQLRETAINGSRPSTPLPLSVLRFTGIQIYSYTDQRKVEADVEVTEDRTGDLLLRKPHTSHIISPPRGKFFKSAELFKE